MQQQDSYSDFMPLRQSSMLTDETLLMNDTNVYANASVVWPVHEAREFELEQAREQYPPRSNIVLEDTLPNESSVNDSYEKTIWTTALDIPFSPEASTDANNQSIFDVYRSVLDYMNKETSKKGKLNINLDQQTLKDTLPMDDEPLNDTLPMEDETLNDTLPMDDDTLNDTLPMDDNENLFDVLIKEESL